MTMETTRIGNRELWLRDMALEADSLEFGMLQITAKKHDGWVVSAEVGTSLRTKYKDDNSAARADVLKMMLSAEEMQLTGSLNFGVMYQNGKATHIVNNANSQHSYG